ncbi:MULTISPECIES: AzlD domain-containing protein [unclassified Salinibacterium]|uniref:AzlD domain-containing protein n=1 Tax=unclassified Salinibacterium TaxID=2632331 RepID=UPI00141DE9F3|nr:MULTISPECIES: AzlD domain-containing protein [unclassified Salinibacterium]
MTIWHVVLLSAIAIYAIKLVGYAIPASILERPAPARVSNLLTVALLAALTATQTLERSAGIELDARLPAVVFAGVLLWLKAPFIIVVVGAAVLAAVIRMLGWMA